MAIMKKEKELAAVGISIAAGCKPCTDFHMKAVREAGASDDEIRRAIEDAVALRNAATSPSARVSNDVVLNTGKRSRFDVAYQSPDSTGSPPPTT